MWELQNIIVYLIVLAALFFVVKNFSRRKATTAPDVKPTVAVATKETRVCFQKHFFQKLIAVEL